MLPDWTAETSPGLGAAWQLVEALRETHIPDLGEYIYEVKYFTFWNRTGTKDPEPPFCYTGDGYSDAVNISLAYLRACGVDVEGLLERGVEESVVNG